MVLVQLFLLLVHVREVYREQLLVWAAPVLRDSSLCVWQNPCPVPGAWWFPACVGLILLSSQATRVTIWTVGMQGCALLPGAGTRLLEQAAGSSELPLPGS